MLLRVILPWIVLLATFVDRDTCGMTVSSAIVAEQWQEMVGTEVRCDERLVKAAQSHAEYLAGRQDDALLQSMHTGNGGSTPNERVREQGYELPSHWPTEGNQVESASRNGQAIDVVMPSLSASPRHHDHVLLLGWFSDHTVYGIGHAGDDWVLVTAPEE